MKTKIVIFALLCATLIAMFAMSSYAYSFAYIPEGQHLTDRDNIISSSDEGEINAALSDAEKSSGAKIRAFVYEGSYDYYYTDYIAESEEYIDSLVLLIIQYDSFFDEYYYFLDTYGTAHGQIKDNEVDRILDNPDVYDNIKSGNLKAGITAYARLADKAVSGNLRPNFIKVLIISLVIALLVAFIASLSVYFAYKKKLHSESYPLSRYASLNLKIERDSFVTKFVTRVRIKSSSGGSGRSGGGGHSGGGRRGGR